ncbi:MAG: ectoine synthase [Proteobacteria bacterium]|nr:ectoine synthase [Pseudomonadota bacterium]
MIVRTVEEVKGTEREVVGPTFTSRRLLIKRDGAGFSLHETWVKGGTTAFHQYKNHVEACFCIEGEAEIEVVDEGRTVSIRPGVMYCLDRHDRHIVRAKTDVRYVCVFVPALTGREIHDAEGSYPLIEE